MNERHVDGGGTLRRGIEESCMPGYKLLVTPDTPEGGARGLFTLHTTFT